MIRKLLLLLCLPALFAPLSAQTIEDGIMMRRGDLCFGSAYASEHWDQYWEGGLKRANGNIGKITTTTNTWFANYGVSSRLNVIAMVPYVWTKASQGVLRGMQGYQDLSLTAKYDFLDKALANHGAIHAIASVTGGIPLTDYTPDYQPLSIGLGAKRVSGRFTLYYQSKLGWYLNGSNAYTWRSNVRLDRPYYYTDGRLSLTDQVEMPGVFDYSASAGYLKKGLNTEFSFRQQRMQGGGDIRRQDMPFISNRMNFSRVGGMVMHTIPKLPRLEAKVAAYYTIDGRNVGQALTVMASVQYRISLFERKIR